MGPIAAALLLMVNAPEPGSEAIAPCPPPAGLTRVADSLSGLPAEIRDDLKLLVEGDMGDRDGPLLQTDAPNAAERDFQQTRFYQALLVGDRWLVQFEVSLFAGVRTVVYSRSRDATHFQRDPSRHFGGPACESINAVLSGVTTPPG